MQTREEQVAAAIQTLNEREKVILNGTPKVATEGFNCWGFTARMLGWVSKFYWMRGVTMDALLLERSVPVTTPEPGDIAVFRCNGACYDTDLAHTAIVLKVDPRFDGKNLHNVALVHKPAGSPLEVTSIEKSHCDWPGFGKFVEFRRPNLEMQTA